MILINSKDDIQWLKDVHVKNIDLVFNSAILYGNEDCPIKIELFEKKEPLHTDSPLLTLKGV
jgi:hypothetical protein